MKKKEHIFKRMLCLLILFVFLAPSINTHAACSSGIKNNGLGGIAINVNSSIYADSRWGTYGDPYGPLGCTWFVGARVMELTGKGTYNTQVGSTWMNSYGSSLGFSTGQNIQAPAVICWSGHVAILEKIVGDTAYISEGGSQYYSDYAHGYTIVRTVNVSNLKTLNSGFLGFVYLPGAGSGVQPVQMTFDWDDCQPSKNDVYVYERANPGVTGTFTEAGITFWDSLGRYVGSKTEYINTTYSYLEMWYTASGDLGVSLQPGTIYSYQFYTVYNGTRYNGPVKSFATVWNETFALATPKLVSVTQGNGSVTVKCEPVSGSVGYRFYRRTGNSTYWEVMADLQQTTFVDNAVQDGEKYTYTVRAYRDNIEMANANTYSTTYWSDYDPNGLSITYKVIKEGWQQDSNGWKYRKADGSFLNNGWSFIAGEWYYFNVSGYRLESQWIENCYVKADGTMATNEWVGNYYVKEDGTKATSQWIGDYYVKADGTKARNEWVGNYYVKADGTKATSQWIGDYYVKADGTKATNEWIGNYYVKADGTKARNEWVGNYYVKADGTKATSQWIGDYYVKADGTKARNEWVDNYYVKADGTKATSQWIGDYYVKADGTKATNEWIGNYYVKADGTKATNQWVGNYYVDENGVYVSRTGWLQVSGKWYYLGIGGVRQTGWQYVGSSWYYMNASGIMQTGWQYIGGTWYYLNTSGAMLTGWQCVGGTWYYLNASGAMQTGWQYLGGTWYYLNTSGAMVTGWQAIGGTWYYFHGSGAMAANQWVGNYYLQSDGSMATNKWIGQYYVGPDGVWIP